MGIFLNFRVSPERIPENQWERVYEEALCIADRSDLLDSPVLERNGQRYIAGRKTAERLFPKDGLGIHVCGAMASGRNMEDFYLFRRRPRCCGTAEPEYGGDILFENWYPEDPDIPVPTDPYVIWGSKTQGRPGHIPLLAIACLFADRFPEAVKISGDITAGQCRAAVQLANQCLERPIQTPVTCRAEALVRRLRGTGIPVQKQLAAFFRLYLGRLTPETGEVLKQLFPGEALYQYFRARMAEEKPGTAWFEKGLRDYLLLELDAADLLNMLVRDPSGPRLPLEEVLSELFACKVHIPLDDKNCFDPLGLEAAVDGDEEAPHEIEAFLGRAFFVMFAGRNRSLPVYLPLETIRDACRQLCPEGNTDALIDGLLAKPAEDTRQEQVYGTDSSALLNQLLEKDEEQREAVSAYDLQEPKDLRRWRPGLTIEPALEKNLLSMMRQLRTFSVGQEYQKFLALDRAGRETHFIRSNRNILIYEAVWEHIFSRILDDAYIYRYFLLFCVDCSREAVHDIMAPLLTNPPLIDMLWDRTAEDSPEREA